MNIVNDYAVNRSVVALIVTVATCLGLGVSGLTITQFIKAFGRWGDRNRRVALEKAENKKRIELAQFSTLSQKYGEPGTIQPLNNAVQPDKTLKVGSIVRVKPGTPEGGGNSAQINGRPIKSGDITTVKTLYNNSFFTNDQGWVISINQVEVIG